MERQRKKILIVEPTEKIYESLRAVLKVYDIEVIKTDLWSIPETLKEYEGFLKPVLACSPGSWKYLRWVNIWQEIMEDWLHDVAPYMKRIFNQHMVIPVVAIPNQDIFDIIASKKISMGNILYWIISNTQTSQNNEILVKAARKKIAAYERHEISSKIPDPHDRHDLLSALRLIHGAFLFGTIGEAKGIECYQSVCHEIGDLPTTTFFSTTAQEENLEPSIPISSVLLIDDKQYWYSALKPILESLRINTLHNSGNSFQSVMEVDSQIPIRAIMLDLEFPQGKWHGAALLSQLDHIKSVKNQFPWLKKRLPIILLSVDDTFSRGAFLKKIGAFAFISKNPNERELGNRDELIAFMQLKDLVIFAQFASLANDLEDWLERISELDRNQMLHNQDFRTYASSALNSLYEECHRIFHGKWQDYDFPVYLGTQQVIRAFGKLNDKWCELCKDNPASMNPDKGPKEGDWDREWENKRWPHQAYHYILTNIRNIASHAVVEDEKFNFVDAWIAIVTFMLKLDGIHATGSNCIRGDIDSIINGFVYSLAHLLFLIKVIPKDKLEKLQSVQDNNFKAIRDEVADEIHGIYEVWKLQRKGKLSAYIDYGEWVEKPDIRDSSLLIGMDPYFLRFRNNAKLCFEYLDEDKYEERTFTQKICDLFLLILISCRLNKAKSEIPNF